jgi:ribosomal protein L32
MRRLEQEGSMRRGAVELQFKKNCGKNKVARATCLLIGVIYRKIDGNAETRM